MIKALLMILLSSGYIHTSLSGTNFPTKAACEAVIGKSDPVIAKFMHDLNKSNHKVFGTADGVYEEMCLTRKEYNALVPMLKKHNAPIMEEYRRLQGKKTSA
jgi:hypothetical protein